MNPCRLWIGTTGGMFTVEYQHPGPPVVVGDGLTGQSVRGIALDAAHPAVAYVACGHGGWGLHRTLDGGRTYQTLGLEEVWVWDVTLGPGNPQRVLAGTEPPGLYQSRDGGTTIETLGSFDDLPSRPRWTFFYPPFYGGHVHGIAVDPVRPERIYAGVEHGALIYTHDGGRSWHDRLPGYDLHRIAIDPVDPDRVLAGAGEGLLVSEDSGETWEAIPELEGSYVHALRFDPVEPAVVYAYAQETSPLHKSTDGGRSWRKLSADLPHGGPADAISIHPDHHEVLFYAGEGDARRGRLFLSDDGGESWRELAVELPKIWRMRAGRLD